MSSTRLILIRHGETIANREFRYIGMRDDALSERGERQARQLADALSHFPLAAIYSSPLQRAYHTAQAIAVPHGLSVAKLETLRECSFGTWEGLSRAEVLARSPEDAERLLRWEKDMNVAPPDGESFETLRQRVCTDIEQLAHKHPDETIALVAHVGPIKVLLCAALAAPTTTAFRIFLDPATISVVDWKIEEQATVRLINSHAHLGWQEARWM